MMRYLSLLFFLVLDAAFLSAETGRDVYILKDSLKGVYRMYDFEAPRSNAPAPKGYKVFYLSHYGRHGSRYIHDEREYDSLNVVLHREVLTPYGELVRERFDEHYPSLKGRAADLSEVGKMQHRMLARRMMEDYPELFGRGASVRAVSSDIPRCLMSMHNFLDELRIRRRSLDIYAGVNSSMVPLFRPSPVRRFPMKEFMSANFDAEPLFGRLFASPDEAMARTDAGMFAQTLYYYASHLEGVMIEDDFFDAVLIDDEISALFMIENEKFSYHRGALCPDNLAVAGPSLAEIISSADRDIESGDVSVRLRFGHDNMVMNIMSLMGVPPFDKARFSSSDVPMASNIRFVFARDRSGDVLVKIQYNENDVMGWISWKEFREYCLERISWRPEQRSVLEKNSIYSPKFMAHRGLQSMGPENSFTAFRAAAERGVWAIETDFRITADGHVVCMHDRTLDRTTDGAGMVAEKTLEEIRALKVQPVNTRTVRKQYDYELIPDEDKRIPLMDEYFAICREGGCVAFVELKEDEGVIDAMIASIAGSGMTGRCIISSGKLELLERYRASGGREMIHLIFAKPEDLPRVCELGNASVSFRYSVLDQEVDVRIGDVRLTSLKELVDHVHSLGLKICFRAADDREASVKSIGLGVDCIPTNVMYSLE